MVTLSLDPFRNYIEMHDGSQRAAGPLILKVVSYPGIRLHLAGIMWTFLCDCESILQSEASTWTFALAPMTTHL